MQTDHAPSVEEMLTGISAPIPDKLLCEACGENTVDVIVTHLGSADNDRHCYPCFFRTTAQVIREMADAESAA